MELGVGKIGQRRRSGEGGESCRYVEFVASELDEEVGGDIGVDVGGCGDDLKAGRESEWGVVGQLEESGEVEKGCKGRLLMSEGRDLLVGGGKTGIVSEKMKTQGGAEAKVDSLRILVIAITVEGASGEQGREDEEQGEENEWGGGELTAHCGAVA